ncbi:MAG TPA: acyltransferase family protein [Jatrophihabitans sp.]|jgi:peptidoglycan/LPS O-acetylase OafA/YrhL|nr:acyltransferase family protein [Jatrophihabitans sp.]
MSASRHGAAAPLPAIKSRADIQGLRALAVLLVVVGHGRLIGLTGGYIGVDVFFVISGFLITSILLHEATSRGSLSLIGFYGKRARRILPAATVTLVATAIAATLLLPYLRAQTALKDVAWATMFAANVRFGQARTDYFAPDVPPSPVQHYWSLAVEEQFYLVWPALIVLVIVLGTRGSASVVCRRLPRLALLVAALSGLSLAWSIKTTHSDPTTAYFSTFTRCWELGAGALLAFAGLLLPRLPRYARSVFSWLGLGSVLYAGFAFTDHTPVPGYHMALPVVGTAMLIAAGTGVPASTAPVIVRILGRQPLRWIGDVSYGFYLWHWPFLILGTEYVGHSLDRGTTALLMCAALVMAWLSYQLIENPIRRAKSLSRRPRFALLLWPAAICSLVVTNVGSNVYINHERSVVASAAANVDISKLPSGERAPRDGNRIHDAIADSLDRASLDAPQAPKHLERIGPWLRDQGCGAAEAGVKHRLCVMGDVHGSRLMVALGDSHMLMWLSALEPIAERNGYQFVPITKLGCSPYDVLAWDFKNDEEYTTCNKWRSWALRQIRKLQPEVVIVGSASDMKSMDPSTGRLLSASRSQQVWRAGARSLARQLTAVTPEVRFLQDVNRLPMDPADCLSDLKNTAADCTFPPAGKVTESNQLVRRGIAATGAKYVRLRDLFCMEGRCPTVVNGIQVYGDNDHITSDYVRYILDDVEPRLRLPIGDRGA